jgi:hypothetical protein
MRWAMSSITPAELAEMVPDLRVFAATFSRRARETRSRQIRLDSLSGEIDIRYSVRGTRFNPRCRWACTSLSRIWAKKRGGSMP